MATQPPPPYDANAQRDPAQPAPATNLPSDPIAMQPVGQANMNTGQKVTPLHLLSDKPEWIDCQMCEQRARTRVEKKGEGMQFLTGAILCLVCICLAPLPCCLHWFEQTNWYCDKCNKQIATRTPESPVHVLPPPHALQVPSQYAQNPAVGQQHPPPHMNAPQSPPVGPPMSPPSNAYTATPPPVIQTPPGDGQAPPPVIQNPEILNAPTPGQAPGGPESLPMKN